MTTDNRNPRTGQNSLTISLSGIAGLGVILMVVAALIGVVEGTSADSTLIGTIFGAGVLLLIAGAVAWGGVVRPWENFDDINEPHYHGHHHDEHDHDDEAASHEVAAH